MAWDIKFFYFLADSSLCAEMEFLRWLAVDFVPTCWFTKEHVDYRFAAGNVKQRRGDSLISGYSVASRC